MKLSEAFLMGMVAGASTTIITGAINHLALIERAELRSEFKGACDNIRSEKQPNGEVLITLPKGCALKK